MTDKQTFYMTRYSLANSGIIQPIEGRLSGDRYVHNSSFHLSLIIGRDCFNTAEEAKAAVRAARDKKIASLKKQIAKLEKLEPHL